MAAPGEVAGRGRAYGRGMRTLTDEKAAARAMWGRGDYHRFATQLTWELGPVMVEAAGLGPGMRVLDVAAGSGAVAVPAAQAGADVVASDLTPENLAAGRAAAEAAGVGLAWVEADAEALPFADSQFDAVTSSLGAMFAPDHRAVARELLRVCRPGGTIALASFTPEGAGGDFFATVGRHAPPPPGESPLLWGDEGHVRDLLDDGVASLRCERRTYVERLPGGPGDYAAFFRETFGPLIVLREALSADPARLAALDRDLDAFAERSNAGPPEGPFACPYEYLLVVARKDAAT
jgi:ubiquinone/menaquinone biosynthesis C-methylase UbiE